MSSSELINTLQAFFPQTEYSSEAVVEGITNGDIVVNSTQMANYLQGALHDESLLEVELDNDKRVFFCRILDHPPEEDTPDEDVLYTKGEYLENTDHIILTPLEPAEGNYLINASSRILIRVLTSQAAVEFCCNFDGKIKIDTMPVLQTTFPVVARQVKGAREYRVKVPSDMDLTIIAYRKRDKLKFTTRPMDMSINGMSLYDPKGKHSTLQTDDKLSLQITSDDMLLMTLDAVVRHVTRLRDNQGLQYVFGVKFNLESRASKAEVEKLVASIQRARLRKLAEIEGAFGVNFSDW